MSEIQVKTYIRNGRRVRGYRRRAPGSDPVDKAIKRARENVSWSKSSVTGVSFRDRPETYTWNATGSGSNIPAALIMRLDPKVFSPAQRRRLEAIVKRTARYRDGRLANAREIMAAVKREASKMVKANGTGGTIRPVGAPRRARRTES